MAVFDELSKHYPKLFIKDKPLPLKVGIHIDIFKDYQLSVSKRDVRKFLHRYVNSKTYQELHIENAVRYDLLGEESGVVTKENLDLMVKRKEERKKMISTEKVEIGEVKKDKSDKIKNFRAVIFLPTCVGCYVSIHVPGLHCVGTLSNPKSFTAPSKSQVIHIDPPRVDSGKGCLLALQRPIRKK